MAAILAALVSVNMSLLPPAAHFIYVSPLVEEVFLASPNISSANPIFTLFSLLTRASKHPSSSSQSEVSSLYPKNLIYHTFSLSQRA
jgi:hypothetical protein